MPGLLAELSRDVLTLKTSIDSLAVRSRWLELPPLEPQDWYRILTDKLVPQLDQTPFLVVAVVGGTNIGKSVIFNHLAGFRGSESCPFASGTKHPVCVIPAGFSRQDSLAELFPGFTLEAWDDPQKALAEDATHRLYWQVSEHTPPNLLLLDTPDVDSDAPINWERADAIRRVSDVLVAVLTQQKYNDAAVKQFFRKAAEEGKAAIIVFNQVLLPDDEPIWPQWLQTFTTSTGLAPSAIFLAPLDRRAAEGLSLPFYERSLPTGTELQPAQPVSLMDSLSRLKFEEIKLQTLRGALERVVDPTDGLPAYLAGIRQQSLAFRGAGELLSSQRLAEYNHWPQVPARLVVQQVRQWWTDQRQGWSKTLHRFYDQLGSSLLWPIQALSQQLAGPAEPPWSRYRELEWQAALQAVERVYLQLTLLAELGNPLLQPRLEQLLRGSSRERLLSELKSRQDGVDYDHLLAEVVRDKMLLFQKDQPGLDQFMRRLDQLAAVARPATSIALFVVGVGLPLGEIVAPLVGQAATHAVLHAVGDAAGGAAVAVVGEQAVSGAVSQGAGYLEAWFRGIQLAFTSQRVEWLTSALERQLLGELTMELREATAIASSPELERVEELQRALTARVRQIAGGSL